MSTLDPAGYTEDTEATEDTALAEAGVLVPGLADLPGYLLWRAHARVMAEVSRTLPTGVDVHAYATLEALSRREPLSQQELARIICVSATTMVGVADDLQHEKLIRRVRNPDDRRSYALTRTPEAVPAGSLWRPHVEQLEHALTHMFSDAERDRLREHLQVILADHISPDTPSRLLASISFLVTRVHFRLHKAFLEDLRPVGIEPRHFGLLQALASTGPVSQGDAARLLGVTGATIVETVDHLEDRGLVARRRNPDDRRSYLLELQEGATRVLQTARRKADAQIDLHLGGLDPAARTDLISLLQRFLTQSGQPDGVT